MPFSRQLCLEQVDLAQGLTHFMHVNSLYHSILTHRLTMLLLILTPCSQFVFRIQEFLQQHKKLEKSRALGNSPKGSKDTLSVTDVVSNEICTFCKVRP